MNLRHSKKPLILAVFIIPAVLFFGAITMLLWNWLVPTLFGGPHVTLLQALGLLILAKILFSSGHEPHHRFRPPASWRQDLRDKIGQKHFGSPHEPGTETESTEGERTA